MIVHEEKAAVVAFSSAIIEPTKPKVATAAFSKVSLGGHSAKK